MARRVFCVLWLYLRRDAANMRRVKLRLSNGLLYGLCAGRSARKPPGLTLTHTLTQSAEFTGTTKLGLAHIHQAEREAHQKFMDQLIWL